MELLKQPPTGKAPAESFTGDAWWDVIYRGEEPSRARANLVKFSPGARTAWHSHGLGQTLYIVEGIALVQSRGGEIIEAYPGPQTVTEGTDAIVGLATEGPGHRSGRFVDRDGEIKWS